MFLVNRTRLPTVPNAASARIPWMGRKGFAARHKVEIEVREAGVIGEPTTQTGRSDVRLAWQTGRPSETVR